MRTLLGLFGTREQGLAALERLRAAGISARTLETTSEAAAASRGAGTPANRPGTSGAAVGALAGGIVGAVPGAVLGALLGHGLSDMNARRYGRVLAEGGIALAVETDDIQGGARAEDILHQAGAEHVHTGEVPTA